MSKGVMPTQQSDEPLFTDDMRKQILAVLAEIEERDNQTSSSNKGNDNM